LNRHEKPGLLLKFFLDKHIIIKGPFHKLSGKLLAVQHHDKKQHIPPILIFQTGNGKTIWRGDWVAIVLDAKV